MTQTAFLGTTASSSFEFAKNAAGALITYLQNATGPAETGIGNMVTFLASKNTAYRFTFRDGPAKGEAPDQGELLVFIKPTGHQPRPEMLSVQVTEHSMRLRVFAVDMSAPEEAAKLVYEACGAIATLIDQTAHASSGGDWEAFYTNWDSVPDWEVGELGPVNTASGSMIAADVVVTFRHED